MVAIKTLLALLPLALAAPVEVEVRQSGASTCGNNYYSASKLRSAANAASNYVQQGTTAGGSTYPHKYNNYEGFDFPDNGPYYEFPLKESGVYSGGSPGADRVIVNGDGEYEGSITHTGASGNNFVACSDTN